jgi:hypothetical protein
MQVSIKGIPDGGINPACLPHCKPGVDEISVRSQPPVGFRAVICINLLCGRDCRGRVGSVARGRLKALLIILVVVIYSHPNSRHGLFCCINF